MERRRSQKGLIKLAVLLTLATAACRGDGFATISSAKPQIAGDGAGQKIEIVDSHSDGTPLFVRGDFGRISTNAVRNGADDTEQALRGRLDSVVRTFGLAAKDLRHVKGSTDQLGTAHHRYQQVKDGLDVIGADLIVHVARNGMIYAVNGTPVTAGTQGRVRATLSQQDAERAALATLAGTSGDQQSQGKRLVYVANSDRSSVLAWEVEATAAADAKGTPVRNLAYIDARSGAVLKNLPQVFTAKAREVYDAKNTQTSPGTLVLTETTGTSTDASVNGAFNGTGATWEFYNTNLGRDSYDNQGGKLISTVHYGVKYNNAFWNGSTMTYGDGDGDILGPTALSVDVTAHELTHGVTQETANLEYAGQSGGLNEAMSDIIGCSVEAWQAGGVNANTWLLGEGIWTPNTPGDALRYMDDPAKDGDSIDYAPDFAGQDVHYTSGVPNLAFYLTSQGGKHPRGKTTNLVAGIGIEKAAKIYYRALSTYLTSTSGYGAAKLATIQAALDLYDTATAASVRSAWEAVGVGSSTGGTTGGGTNAGSAIALANGVDSAPLTANVGVKTLYKLDVPAGASSLKFNTRGATGDADLYVAFDRVPTTNDYDFASYSESANEDVASFVSLPGTWYVLVDAYSALSGVTVNGSYLGGDQNPTYTELFDGIEVTVAGATDSDTYYVINVPAGSTLLTVSQSGGTGDSDMFLRFGDLPSPTAFDHTNWGPGNHEQIRVANPKTGKYFLLVHGTAGYAGVTINARY